MKKAVMMVAMVSVLVMGCGNTTNNNTSSTESEVKEEKSTNAEPTEEDIEEAAVKAVQKQIKDGHLIRSDGTQSSDTIDMIIDPESCVIRASDISKSNINDCWEVTGIVALYDKHGNETVVFDDGSGPSRVGFKVNVQNDLSAECTYFHYR